MLSPRNKRVGERLREPFGKAGLTVAVIALVFAMFGGAYAASNNGGGKATASAKKGPRGPRGKTGATGPAGPAGPAGAAGAKGDKGDTGAEGKEGPPGAPGKNGTNGKDGKTGFTKTLPPGETETGTWTLGFVTEGAAPGFSGQLRVPISFDIPLAAGLSGSSCNTVEAGPPPHVASTCHVHFINKAGKEIVNNEETFALEELASPACTGTAAAPSAAAGNLCVYAGKDVGANALIASGLIQKPEDESAGASTAGAMIGFFGVKKEAVGFGTWAVTAEE